MKTPENASEGMQPEQEPVKIEISQYNSLIQLLSDHRSVCRLILTVCLLLLVLFAGLSVITIIVKQIYPYNDIRTNMRGATTMRDESTEVTYWLFNTAELWANSGIHVDAGDILTIRASGKAHTAIHHLVDNVRQNVALQDKWVGTAGDERDETTAHARGKYRIFADKPQDALVMQVIPEDKDVSTYGTEYFLRPDGYITSEELKYKERKEHRENFYFIGKERVDLHINHSGVLHFAVNDIPLTKRVILAMLCEMYGLDLESELNRSPSILTDQEAFRKWFAQNIDGRKGDSPLKLGTYQGPDKFYSGRNELLYYYDRAYYAAWYDDNVGSFLVVIERKHKK